MSFSTRSKPWPPPLEFSGEGLTVLTNGGGVGVLATDGLIDREGRLRPCRRRR